MQFGVTPSSSYFIVNPKFNLRRLPSPLRVHILQVKTIEGRLPFDIPIDLTGISEFPRFMTQKQLGAAFTKDYVEKFVKRANIKVTLASEVDIGELSRKYGSISNFPTNIRLMFFAKKISDHHECNRHALTNLDNAIVVELPVFDPKTKKLAGHIDLLVQEKDGHLVVWDYKPQWSDKKWNPRPSVELSRNFIVFVPQIASYALTLMHMLGLKGVTCGIYNSEGTWEFDSVEVMKILNSDFPTVSFPWRNFKFLGIM